MFCFGLFKYNPRRYIFLKAFQCQPHKINTRICTPSQPPKTLCYCVGAASTDSVRLRLRDSAADSRISASAPAAASDTCIAVVAAASVAASVVVASVAAAAAAAAGRGSERDRRKRRSLLRCVAVAAAAVGNILVEEQFDRQVTLVAHSD